MISHSNFEFSHSRPLAALFYALFLGTSWTWCIGMFWPVILLRDYGIGGFAVFAVPNVLGAATMGWVLKSSTDSLSLAFRHERMGVWFSIVTIAFHLFFLTWIVSPWVGPSALVAVPLWIAIVSVARLLTPAGDKASAALVYLISLAAAGVCLMNGGGSPGTWGNTSRVLPQLAMIAPVCVFGFLLCPYLDLTFHRARQSTTPDGGKLAFGLGFGGFFFSMILFTLVYAPPIDAWLGGTLTVGASTAFAAALGVHWIAQSSLTISFHAREIANRMTAIKLIEWLLAAGLMAAAMIAGRSDFAQTLMTDGRRGGELIYLSFLGAYGLLFPAYVWLCMIPNWKTGQPKARHWLVWMSAVIVASPLFAAGFLYNRHVWLVPGVAVILLARLLIPSAKARMSEPG